MITAVLAAGKVAGAFLKAIPARVWLAIALIGALATSHLWYGSARYSAAEKRGNEKLAALQGEFDAYSAQVQENARIAQKIAFHVEQNQRDAFAAIDAKHKKDLTDAKLKHDAVVADLRAGNLRLRKHWQGCTAPVGDMPQAAGAAGVVDDDAELRAADAGNLVRLAAEADAQIVGLQSALKVCNGG